mmetsp:Transcript_19909/g.40559  ORF Transcript_19909/g.40559 Transcript_19909/m.40559 type:complete len:144 (-) Transcript_19909:192-623(-)
MSQRRRQEDNGRRNQREEGWGNVWESMVIAWSLLIETCEQCDSVRGGNGWMGGNMWIWTSHIFAKIGINELHFGCVLSVCMGLLRHPSRFLSERRAGAVSFVNMVSNGMTLHERQRQMCSILLRIDCVVCEEVVHGRRLPICQ